MGSWCRRNRRNQVLKVRISPSCLVHTLNTFPDCCMSGCAICVNDLYADALNAYKESVALLRANLSARAIPESQWPARIRTYAASTTAIPEPMRSVALSAFEEMERALAAKRAKADAPSS
jgi:hypothetical protein